MKNMKKIYGIIFIATLVLSSCATNYPPSKHNIVKTAIINKPFDEVWLKTIDWFGENNTPIKNMDKLSGFISSERNLKADEELCDCGYKVAATRTIQFTELGTVTGSFNIVIRKINENQTKIDINTQYNYSRFMTYNGTIIDDTHILCTSYGKLEKDILTYLDPSIKIILDNKTKTDKVEEELK